ncbi:MAG: M28 family peptidase [Gemmatimonadetes bacterium]|nr:M28 family peptidase [Gemmatimonadota bacterium]
MDHGHTYSMLLAVALSLGCRVENAQIQRGLNAINVAGLAQKIQVLAADSMEGRAPSSAGEEKTVRYLVDQFRQLGLRSGSGEDYVQQVPLVSIAADRNMTLAVQGRGKVTNLRYGDQFVGFTSRVVERAGLQNSELVFAGYGIVAPEYGWNDFAGTDVKGKTIVVLVNDPGFATGDTTLFKGHTMTYYGRWTYKYEEAARQGAAGVLVVHETEPAGYPWEVVTGSWSGARFALESADTDVSRAAVEGWMTADAARQIFRDAGLDYDSLKARASQRGFKAVPLGLRASLTVRNTLRRSSSRNVLAVLPGTTRADQYVIYMAHWDHLGRDTTLEGDQIYNGALDNASGVAGLLELAKAFAALDRNPARSVLFLAVTAEEQGLLGSQYYATHPVYPLNQTVAAINLDGLNSFGPMRDITVIGYGNSELDDYVVQAAKTQNRAVRPDPEPEKGFYFRSDHFSLAKVGVPALDPDAGTNSVQHGESWARQQRDEYTAQRYHKPADEYDPAWDLSGAVDDLRLFFRVGYRLANEATFPNWRAGTEFKAARDAMMAGAR